MSAATPTLEFLRVAQLAKQTTGLTPAADTSTHDTTGLWQLRDAHNETICEVSPDGTVVEAQVEAPPFGLLDRIRDLRACGYSTRAIHGWFGTPQSVDELMEARVVFNIAMDHMAAMSQPLLGCIGLGIQHEGFQRETPIPELSNYPDAADRGRERGSCQ